MTGLTCHHVVPRRSGGQDTEGNLAALCSRDHSALHLICDRDLPFLSRLLIGLMVIVGPSPMFFWFLRRVFDALIRRGSGFHPARLKIRLRKPHAPVIAQPQAGVIEMPRPVATHKLYKSPGQIEAATAGDAAEAASSGQVSVGQNEAVA
jgi:hypothetical protein